MWLAAVTATLWLTSPLPAQEGPADTEASAEEPERRATNISWNPLTTQDEIRALRRTELTEFDPATKQTVLSAPNEQMLAKYLQNAVNSLTVEQEVDNFPTIIERRILAPIERGSTSDAARAFMLDFTMKAAEQLLQDQPPIVQYNAVSLISQLNARPADNSRRPPVPAAPYLPTIQPLLRVLSDQSLPVHCRIMACRGLSRILRNGEPSTPQRADIGAALAAAMRQPVRNPLAAQWLRLRIIEALGLTGRLYDINGAPVIVDALLNTVAAKDETWVVRSAAARALSQLPFEGTTNVELINHEIAKLARELAVAYNADRNKRASQWRWSFATLYLSYMAETEADQKVRKWGLRSQNQARGRAQVDAAYQALLPIFKQMIEGARPEPIPDARITALNAWLDQNKPADRKATPRSEELKELAASPEGAVMSVHPVAAETQEVSRL
ncbi:MAG: hypothetical protein KF774_10840 [Planctomyces sp.]|nr:hypothetical protein [Planctomyces sp.]